MMPQKLKTQSERLTSITLESERVRHEKNNNDDTVDSGESKSFNNINSLPDLRGIIDQKVEDC